MLLSSSLAVSAVFPYGERTHRQVGLSAPGQRGWPLFQGIGETNEEGFGSVLTGLNY